MNLKSFSIESGKNFLVRSAEEKDAKSMAILLEKVFGPLQKESDQGIESLQSRTIRVAKALENDDCWSVLVFDEAGLVAFAVSYPAKDPDSGAKPSDTEHLRWLIVDPEYWGRGIGSRLLDLVLGHSRTVGRKDIVLWTRHDNTRAKQLYERKGYRLTGEQTLRPGATEVSVQYVLDL